MKYKIEKTIPVPAQIDGRGMRCKYPWPDMEVGDSVVVETPVVYNSGYQWGKRHGRKFVSRSMPNRNIRVWRVT